MWAVVPYLHIKAFVYYENYCSWYQKPYFPPMLLGESISLWGICIVCYLFGIQSTMSGPHSFIMRRRKVIGQAGTEEMSPLDVEEFRTGILDAGARLVSLVVVQYPNACLVGDALFGVTEVVECYGLKGQWVMSSASSAHNEFLATDSVREVSGCVGYINMSYEFSCC